VTERVNRQTVRTDNVTWICVEYVAMVREAKSSPDVDTSCEILMEIGQVPVSVFVRETVAEVMSLLKLGQQGGGMVIYDEVSRMSVPRVGAWDKPFPAGAVVPSDVAPGMRGEVQKDLELYGTADAVAAFDGILSSAGPPPANPEVIPKWAPDETGECVNCGFPKSIHCAKHPGEPCCPGNPEDPCQLPKPGEDVL
jgi:hypothetical protein